MFGALCFLPILLIGLTSAQCPTPCSLCKVFNDGEMCGPPGNEINCRGQWKLQSPNPNPRCTQTINGKFVNVCLYRREEDSTEMCFCDPGNSKYEQCSYTKLQFQLKGKTGREKVTISIDSNDTITSATRMKVPVNEEQLQLTTKWQTFSYPRPSRGSFSVEYHNLGNDDGGVYVDDGGVYVQGHESQVEDLLPDSISNKVWGCGTEQENKKCVSLRDGYLIRPGKYTYTLRETPERYAVPADVDPMAIFSIATFVIGQIEYFVGLVESSKSHKELINKLNEIKDITESTQRSVHELVVATNFIDQQILLTQAQTQILSLFNRMDELTRDKAPNHLWDIWADQVIRGSGGTATALSTIHTQIINNDIITKFKNKLAATESAGGLSRTVAGSIADFFKLQVIFQFVGFETLQKAYKWYNEYPERNTEYMVMIQRYNKQIQQSNVVATNFEEKDKYLKNPGWGIMVFSMKENKLANLVPVEADEGQVITGVKLCRDAGIFSMKIHQGKLEKFGKIVNKTWKPTGNAFNQHMKVYDSRNHYVDTHTVMVPNGMAVVGISFYQKGNRLAVKVKAASVDYLSGEVTPFPQWITNDNWGNDVYSTKDHKYVDEWEVDTQPSGMLTGVGLYLKGNRLAVKVRDVFEPLINGISCPGNDLVKMDGHYDCCYEFPYNPADQTCPSGGIGPEYKVTASIPSGLP